MSDTELPSIVEFSSDLSKAEAPEPLPVGEYEANITTAEIKTSQKGTRYAEIRWNVSPDQYPADYGDGNPNGSLNNIAGIVNKKGNILGMMPHPDRSSEGILGSTDGKLIFESMVQVLTIV